MASHSRVLQHLGAAYLDLLDKAPGFVAILEGRDHRFVYFNDAYAQLVGGRPLAGKSVCQALPEIIGQDFPELLDQVFDTGQSYRTHCAEAKLRDGPDKVSTRYLEFVYEPIRAENGEIIGIFVGGVELTAGMGAQNESIRGLLDRLPQMIWTHNQLGGTYYNQRWRDFTGCEDANRPDFDGTKLIHPEDRDAAADAWRRAQSTGQYQAEFRLRHHTGEHCWVLSSGNPTFDEGGNVSGWFGTCTEIHDRVVIQQKVHDLQEELRKAARSGAIDWITATLAHELNQPLAAAALYLSGSKRLAAEQNAHSVVKGVDEAQRQISRVGEIISHARAAVLGQGSVRQNISLSVMVDEAAMVVRATDAFRRMAVETQFDQSAEIVHVNRVQIEQVFTNIFRNACQAMRHQKVKSVRVAGTLKPDGKIEVVVTDRGPGLGSVPEGTLSDTVTGNKLGGMGLGLSISRTIIEAHGGKLWWRNDPGGGASFFFTLPPATP